LSSESRKEEIEMTNDGFSIVVLATAAVFISWLVASSIVVIWWFFRPDKRDAFMYRSEGGVSALYVGAFLSLTIVLQLGLEKLLVFIPRNWGTFDEDGDFASVRTRIAFLIAFALSLFFAYLFGRAAELRTALEKLRLTEDQLRAANSATYSAEEQVASLEKQIREITFNMEELGLKEAYEKGVEADEAKMDAWFESIDGELYDVDEGEVIRESELFAKPTYSQ
jgi:hypothetical protein